MQTVADPQVAYHPQGDGLVERFNRILLDMLSTSIKDYQGTWEDHIRAVCMAYNTSVQPTTGYTPFYLVQQALRSPTLLSPSAPSTVPFGTNLQLVDEDHLTEVPRRYPGRVHRSPVRTQILIHKSGTDFSERGVM